MVGNPARIVGEVRPPGSRRPGRHRSGLALSLGTAELIKLPKISDPRGNLTFIEGGRHVPFEVRRVYYLYDVRGGESRGGHAHKELEQLIIAVSGSFDVVLDNGKDRQRFHLNRSYYGLYVPRLAWREIGNFSSASVCLVLASQPYDEADYYRDYSEFLSAVRGPATNSDGDA